MSYKLYNNSGEFTIQYNGFDFKVPSGWFEIQSDKLKNFILNKAVSRWGMNIGEKGPEVISESVAEEAKEENKEIGNVVVETKNEVEVANNKPKKAKTSKKIEDLESAL